MRIAKIGFVCSCVFGSLMSAAVLFLGLSFEVFYATIMGAGFAGACLVGWLEYRHIRRWQREQQDSAARQLELPEPHAYRAARERARTHSPA